VDAPLIEVKLFDCGSTRRRAAGWSRTSRTRSAPPPPRASGSTRGWSSRGTRRRTGAWAACPGPPTRRRRP